MNLLFLVVSIFSQTAFADLDSGNYQGVSESGSPCFIYVGEVTFENGIRHPLNERVSVVYQDTFWTLAHKQVVDEIEGSVRFDHQYFQGILAAAENNRFGAQYLKMTIDHESEPHRPVEYIHINDDYKDSAQSKKTICKNLVKL